MHKRALLFAAGLGALAASPPGRSTLKAALVLAEILPSPLHPLARLGPGPVVERRELAHGPVDFYTRRPGAPGVVLVHGANGVGIDDPRVQGLARAFCGVGRSVAAPGLRLAERRVDADDRLRILDAIDALAEVTGPVVVVAFSYGAGLALAGLIERPAIQARVRLVATIGTYFDVVHLIEGLTTGHVCVNGRLIAWQPPAAALEQAGPLLEQALGGRSVAGVAAILANRDPRRAATLIDELPDDLRAMLDAVSPARRAHAIRGPVLALHSRVDPAAPAVESAELVAAVRRRARARLTLVGSLRHVTPAGTILGRLRDAPGMLRFATSILAAQERWLRPSEGLHQSVLQKDVLVKT